MRKINYILNENSNIIYWQEFPFNKDEPFIEIDDNTTILLNYDKIIDGKLIKNVEKEQEIVNRNYNVSILISEIEKYKLLLTNTDYKVIKYMEGELDEESFLQAKEQRKEWRKLVNELSSQLASLEE